MGITFGVDADIYNTHGAASLEGTATIGYDADTSTTRDAQTIGAVSGVNASAAIEIQRYLHMGSMKARTEYCVDVFDGTTHALKFSDYFCNLVTDEGLNAILDAAFKTGLASPLWYIGLVDGSGDAPVYAEGDTGTSHDGWNEFEDYDETDRQAFTPGTIAGGSMDNHDARAVFNISAAGGTIAGCFMSNEEDYVETGTLYGAGSFQLGNRVVEEGDVVKVTCTLHLDQA